MKSRLRELLGLTLAVGLGLGCWLDHAHSRAEFEQARRQAAKFEVQLAVVSDLLTDLGLEADINDHFVPIGGTTSEVRDKFLKLHFSFDAERRFSVGLDTDDAWASKAERFRHKVGKMQP